jgi:oligoendopeptidase F
MVNTVAPRMCPFFICISAVLASPRKMSSVRDRATLCYNADKIKRTGDKSMSKTEARFEQSRWSLADLYPAPDSVEMTTGLDELERLVADFEEKAKRLRQDISVEEFMALVHELESITRLSHRLGSFAGLWFSEDTQDQGAQTLMARLDQLMATMRNRVLPFQMWWKDLDDEDAQRLMESAGDYAYWLEEMRHFKPHTLTEAEEKIINIKDVTGSNALVTLYDLMTNRYIFKLEVEGEEQELTRGELMTFAYHPDADMRARAYQELYRVYGADGPVLGNLYQTLVRDWRNEQMDLRHFVSPIAPRNLSNDVSDEVVDIMLDVCEQNAGLFQEYFQLKARWLGMERLRRYDIYAPVAKSEKRYDYDAAYRTVLDAFGHFSSDMAEMARRVYLTNHLDSEVRKGKRGGAFCWSVTPDLTPWVLVNYQGQVRDVSTLAHELGHAVHSMLAAEHSIFTFSASLPLAETASTFGEMLLNDYLLEREADEDLRRDVLFSQVDDNYATIMRQAYFALFERQAHDMVHQGASVDELGQAYVANLRVQFGDAVEVSEDFEWEWVSIPHIYHTPFYVYAYAFGQLLVLSLYQQYQEEGDAFKPRYLEILSAGGSASPVSVLDAAGIDVRRSEFWQGGFDVVRAQIDRLKALPVPA